MGNIPGMGGQLRLERRTSSPGMLHERGIAMKAKVSAGPKCGAVREGVGDRAGGRSPTMGSGSHRSPSSPRSLRPMSPRPSHDHPAIPRSPASCPSHSSQAAVRDRRCIPSLLARGADGPDLESRLKMPGARPPETNDAGSTPKTEGPAENGDRRSAKCELCGSAVPGQQKKKSKTAKEVASTHQSCTRTAKRAASSSVHERE